MRLQWIDLTTLLMIGGEYNFSISFIVYSYL